MKKNYLIIWFLIASLSGFNSARATIVTITCQNSPAHFLPVTANAVCGDTIRWTWVAGGHVTGPINSTYIPAGAALWNAPIDGSHLSFDYVVTVAGNYHYVCHPSTPHGENGYIVVTCATGIQSNNVQSNISFAYPNPFSEKFTIEESVDADRIVLYDMLGNNLKSVLVQPGQTKTEIDAADLAKGIYFYSIIKQGVIIETRKIVNQ